jgi:nitrate reductase NapE component
MLGVCFGIMLNFRRGFSYQNTGFSLLFAIVLLVISVRQSLLDIYPRPGHEYIGSAIFGIHMPVWSIIIALALLTAYAIKLAILGDDEYLREADVSEFPAIRRIADILSIYVIAICLINLVSVVLQCGFGECHTFGYKLLQ